MTHIKEVFELNGTLQKLRVVVDFIIISTQKPPERVKVI